jgi:hypothetical protein
MIEPGKYDITLHQGATFEMTVQYKDSDGVPINMTGYSVASKMYNRLGTAQLATFSTSWVAQSSGIFKLRLPASGTAAITEQGQYDVLLTDINGDKFYVLEGAVFVNPGLTGRI